MEQNEDSEVHFKCEFELDPNDVITCCSCGFFLLKMGRYEEAEEQFKRALELDPNYAEAHLNYGSLLYEMECYEEAEEHFKHALELDPNYAEAHFYYGLLMHEKNRYEEAEEHYKLTLELCPNDAVTHCNFGLLFYGKRRYERAEEHYKRALELNPNYAEAHFYYGSLLHDIGQYEKAEEHYKCALESDTKSYRIYYNYGLLLQEIGKNEEAAEKYKRALELNPNDAELHYNYGLLMHELGWYEEAEEYYKRILELDPNDADTHCNYGLLCCEIGLYEKAEEHYKCALESDTKSYRIYYNYGSLLQKMKRNEEAENNYKRVLELDPNNAGTHCNYGLLLYETGRYEEANEHYKRALELDNNDADTHYNYGLLLYEIEQYEEANEHYKRALELNPNDAGIHFNCGLLLYEIEQYEEANEHYKRVLELDPNNPSGHAAYSLLLLFMDLEDDAIEETKIASRLFREKGDEVKEHLAFAWLYDNFADKYYSNGNYRESGHYAEMSGNKYIEASKKAGDESNVASLTKGYMLKGRAKIRKLDLIDFQPPVTIEMFTIIMDGIYNASKCYNKAAEVSPVDNQICNACSLSMKCFSEMIDYMLAVIKLEEVRELKNKIKKWTEDLASCEKIYKGSEKGEGFIQSLYKLMLCIGSLEKCKQFAMWTEMRAFEDCCFELIKAANTIEGPLQKIIGSSVEQMTYFKHEIRLYEGILTKPFKGSIHENETLKSKHTTKPSIDPISQKLDQIYENILEIILNAGNDIERRAYSHKDRTEPELRDVLLTSLNSHDEIISSGESFNKTGKTDILVSSSNEIVFIAECKIWRGKQSLKDAISQLFSYLTWRDNRVALIVFYKNREFLVSLKSISNIVTSFFKEQELKLFIDKEYKADVKNIFRFICGHHLDRSREVVLTIIMFDLSL